MNDQLILDNFLETILESDKETINYNGIQIPFPSLAQAELDRQFNLSLKNKISPNEFEKKIEETQLCTKFNLEKKYKIYYFLLYNICYFKKNKINFLNRNDLKIKELNELLFATEEEIVQYYKKIKQYNLN
jgi:hypothetical protein